MHLRIPLTLAALSLLAVGPAAAPVSPRGVPQAAPAPAASSFAARVAKLSEPGGYFDTDNLISNERSYQHVVPALRQAGLTGGAYIGVGPDTNFTYIAQTRPAIAFIIDIRRDNLLLHLLFKALFALAPSRAEFLSDLFGRTPPPATDDWRRADADRLLAYVDRAEPVASAPLRARLEAAMKGFGVPLSAADLETIDRFHRTFASSGTLLKFESAGRAPASYYPTFRDLVLETDRDGHRWSYLASEDDFQFVRSLESRDLVVPVVGDLAGPSALRNIGKLMADRGDVLGAFYASNVEFYLFGEGTFGVFAGNLAQVPHSAHSLVIRSVFRSGGLGILVDTAPGYGSASVAGGVEDLLRGVADGRIRSYADVLRTSR